MGGEPRGDAKGPAVRAAAEPASCGSLNGWPRSSMRFLKSGKRAFDLFFFFWALLSTVFLTAACTDEVAQAKIGMKEREVRELLGEPSFVVTDIVDVRGYLVGVDCPGQSVRVLVYDRMSFREDVFVGIGAEGLVACKRGGRMIRSR